MSLLKRNKTGFWSENRELDDAGEVREHLLEMCGGEHGAEIVFGDYSRAVNGTFHSLVDKGDERRLVIQLSPGEPWWGLRERAGEGLAVYYTTGSTRKFFRSRLARKPEGLTLTFEVPSRIGVEERRRHPRMVFPRSPETRVHCYHAGQVITGQGLDVSASGLAFTTNPTKYFLPQPNAVVTVEFELHGAPTTEGLADVRIKTKAIVRRIQDEVVAVEFRSTSVQDRSLVSSYVELRSS